MPLTPRPPETTTRGGIPIPGDLGVADYVTATGEALRQVDSQFALRSELPAPQGSVPTLPSTPAEGREVYLDVAGGNADGPTLWHLRFQNGGWMYLGGAPLRRYLTGTFDAPTGTAGSFTPSGVCNVAVPNLGWYLVTITVNGNLQGGTAQLNLGVSPGWNAVPFSARYAATGMNSSVAATIPLEVINLGSSANVVSLVGLRPAGTAATVTSLFLSVLPVRLTQ